LHEYLVDFPGKQDVLRYVLTANAPETKDNDFTWRDFQARNNNELVAVLGNFVNRAIVLTHKYFEGKVPAAGEYTDVDKQLFADIVAAKDSLSANLDTFHFREALKDAMEIARLGNRYLQETEPWKLAKTDMERVATIMNVALQICANIAIAFEPFLPFMAEKLRRLLGMGAADWSKLGASDILNAGDVIAPAELLFEKIEDDAIDAQIQRLERIKEENKVKNFKAAPQQEDVEFDTFMKADLRVGTVLECKKVPKADKLLQFLIDDGMGTRTIVSGIAKYYQPEDLIGKQVCFIANLAPRKLKGVVSQGMILSAENADGSLVVMGPTAPVVPGAQVK
jgi:methionyl-tRNA synthetase